MVALELGATGSDTDDPVAIDRGCGHFSNTPDGLSRIERSSANDGESSGSGVLTLPLQMCDPKIIPGVHRRTNALLCAKRAARNVADDLLQGARAV